jgi:tRNA pseudouridine55 synthase
MTSEISAPSEALAAAPRHGVLVLDKLSGITSRAALDQAAAWFPPRTRLGHAGTLDPLASGVLVLLLGQATRLVEFVQELPKTYAAWVRLGVQSDTDDADGACEPFSVARRPTIEDVRQALVSFTGRIEQVPPRYSAAHVDGRRAYKLARKQKDFELAPRAVEIKRLAIESYDYPDLKLDVECSKGTYIRSLARDLGLRLGCGGLIAGLRRTRTGSFRVEESVSLEGSAESAWQHVLPLESAIAHLPAIRVEGILLWRLQQGQVMSLAEIPAPPSSPGPTWAVFDPAGKLALVAKHDELEQRLIPWKVFPLITP